MKVLFALGFMVTPLLEAHAVESSYGRDVNRLRANEAQISNQIRTLRSRYGFAQEQPDGRAESESSESKKPKLLVIHDELKGGRLATGKLLFGKTVSRLVVSGEGAPALIELEDRQGSVSGLRVLGTARASATVGRLSIEFQKLLLSSGAIPLQATALDAQGAQGLVAEVFSSKAWAIAGAMAGSFISGLASAQQTQSLSSFGFSQTQPTGRNALLQGVAQTTADQSKRLLEEATAEKPVLVVEPGTDVTVLIQEEVRF